MSSRPADPEPPARPEGSHRRRWLGPAVLLLLTGAVWCACFAHPAAWIRLGMGGMRPECFGDLYGSLAASDAHWSGLDPFQPNPLDPYWRPHFYSTWWFFFGWFGLHCAQAAWIGSGLVAGTLLALGLWLKPRGTGEFLAGLALLVSPALLFAANRANNDLILFLLLSGALLMLRRPEGGWRLAGMALVAVTAVLKYYPLAALLLAGTARTRRRMLGELGAAAVVLVAGWPSLVPAWHAIGSHWQSLTGGYVFGAMTLGEDLHPGGGWTRGAACGGLLVIAAWAWCRARTAPARPWSVEFLAGSAVLCTCFALGNTYVYKLVYAAWIVPWCWRQRKETPWAGAVLVGLAFAAWGDGLSYLGNNLVYSRWEEDFGRPVHVAVQAGTWLMVAGLTVLLMEFVRSRLNYYRQEACKVGPARA